MNFLKEISLFFLLSFSVSTFAQDATATSLYNKGLASLKARDYENGYAQIEEALKAAEAEGNEKVMDLTKKYGALAAFKLGTLKLKTNAIEEANTLFTRGLEMNPNYSSNIMGIGRVLDAKDKNIEAIKKYFEAVEMAKKNRQNKLVKNFEARATSRIGIFHKAKKYSKVIEACEIYFSYTEHNRIRYYLAVSLSKLNDNTSALIHINKAIELAAIKGYKFDKYFWSKGNILEALNDKKGAETAYLKIKINHKYKLWAERRIKEIQK